MMMSKLEHNGINGLGNGEEATASHERIAKLEQFTLGLAEDMKETNQAVRDTNASLKQLASTVASGFQQVRDELATSRRPQWGIIFSAIGVCFALYTYVASNVLDAKLNPSLERIKNLEGDVTVLTERQQANREAAWKLQERIEVYKELGFFEPKLLNQGAK